jgi:hypothetical protein
MILKISLDKFLILYKSAKMYGESGCGRSSSGCPALAEIFIPVFH